MSTNPENFIRQLPDDTEITVYLRSGHSLRGFVVPGTSPEGFELYSKRTNASSDMTVVLYGWVIAVTHHP